MGKPRIRGQHVRIRVLGADGQALDVGEISKCSVKELGELKKSRAIGEAGITSTKTFEGYDLSFEGGKVDWKLARALHKQNEGVYLDGRSPYFVIEHQFKYGDGSIDTYTYPEVTIHGYSLDIDANDELNEKFEGFCGVKATYTPSGTAITASGTAIDAVIAGLITAALAKDLTFKEG